MKKIKKLNYDLSYYDAYNQKFKCNISITDSSMPEIVSEMLLQYFLGKAKTVMDALQIMEKENPCKFDIGFGHKYYEYKIKKLLVDMALGMTSTKCWDGKYDATAGYIIVKENGDFVCLHNRNINHFENYLLRNTEFETPSSSEDKCDYGKIYVKNQETFIKLCLQIRFRK